MESVENTRSRGSCLFRLGLAGVAAIAILTLATPALYSLALHELGVSELTVVQGLIKRRLGLEDDSFDRIAAPRDSRGEPTEIELDPSFRPFRQIGDRLGERALSNTMLVVKGAALFDANGDGRMDLFMPQVGRNFAKKSDEYGVLEDARIPGAPNTLFINLGNDANGDPIFKPIQELAAANNTHLRDELMIEGRYVPRDRLDVSEDAVGRIATGAIPADFDGDGDIDLYVMNTHYGLPFQTDELAFPVYAARGNMGREDLEERIAIRIRMPIFLWGDRQDGLGLDVTFDGVTEKEGRNTLYLNLGDADGDGIPEWEDATDRLGVGGSGSSYGSTVGDFDRDGDLDLYVNNFHDPDYWGFGTREFGGQPNEFYVNQLAETGQLGFEDRAGAMKVSGLHAAEGLTAPTWQEFAQETYEPGHQIADGQQVGKKADHGWAALFADIDGDAWPDLLVPNDVASRSRFYVNVPGPDGGRAFERIGGMEDPEWEFCGMGHAFSDLDGDGEEELFIANCGGQAMSARNTALMIENDDAITSTNARIVLNYPLGKSRLHHLLMTFDGAGPSTRFQDRSLDIKVHHSPYIPPDMVNPANFSPRYLDAHSALRFDTSITAYEFAWNLVTFDVDNDSDLDVYMAGALARGNDNFVGDWSGSPGRLLVNESTPGHYVFRDRTLEYQALDIADIDYAHNPPRRRAPGTGWHKRDYIYLTDSDSYAGSGVEASKTTIRDLFRMHEAANAILPADLNNDGHIDLVVTHNGGMDSNSEHARNMKTEFMGRQLSVPAPNKVMNPPTTWEPGATFMYINAGPPKGTVGHWVKIKLINPDSHNLDAIGARVVANEHLVRAKHNGGFAFGGSLDALHVGLGSDALSALSVVWPDGDAAPESFTFDPPVVNAVVCIERGQGSVPCDTS